MVINQADRLNSVQEYYFSAKLREIQELRAQGFEIINLGIGSPDLPPENSTIETLVYESGKDENHAYQSYTGIPELKNAFAVWYGQYFGVNLDPAKEILPLMGSKEGITHISMAFLNKGDGVLIPDPGYPTYASVSNLVEACIIKYNLLSANGWYPDFDEIEKNDLRGVKIMWVNYPNMPTGARATIDLFARLIEFGKKHQILIVNDNPYSFIMNSERLSILSVRGGMDYSLELNSLSKSHNMAGWRIGMLAGRSDYLQTVLKVKSNMDSGMFKPIQLAASQALSSGDKWYDELNSIYAKRRGIIFEMLDILNFKYEKGQVGMFVWAQISDEFENAQEFSEMLLKKAGLFITPGFIFGSNGDRFVRLSLCSDNQTLTLAKEKLIKLEKSN